MKSFFVTGATGTIGSALVPLLLDESDITVTLLIRARDAADLNQRFQDLLRFWEINSDNLISRIRVIRGDASQPSFGLTNNEYQQLARETTHIVHSAASVKMNLPLNEARLSAVNSLQEILALAKLCQSNSHLSKVELVSTVGVGGYTPGIIPEEPLPQVNHFHNTYEASKAEAEKIALAAWSELPLTIHRPSMVVGEARTGKVIHFQIFYYLCEFFCGRYSFGFVPNPGEMQLDTIPVDYVAHAVKWSSLTPVTSGKILHLCSGPKTSMKLSSVARLAHHFMRARGEKLAKQKFVPLKLFRALLPLAACCLPEKPRRALKATPMFLNYFDIPQAFANTKTQALLTAQGIRYPDPADYLEKVLDYYYRQRKS